MINTNEIYARIPLPTRNHVVAITSRTAHESFRSGALFGAMAALAVSLAAGVVAFLVAM